MYTFGHWNDASLILKQITISDCGEKLMQILFEWFAHFTKMIIALQTRHYICIFKSFKWNKLCHSHAIKIYNLLWVNYTERPKNVTLRTEHPLWKLMGNIETLQRLVSVAIDLFVSFIQNFRWFMFVNSF